MTNKRGRPEGPTKEGFHRHPESMRWHPFGKKHHSNLHLLFKGEIETLPVRKKVEVQTEGAACLGAWSPTELTKTKETFPQNIEVLSLIKDIEKGIEAGEILKTIEEIIKTLLLEDVENPKRDIDFPYRTRDKAEPFGAPDSEEREVISVGMP